MKWIILAFILSGCTERINSINIIKCGIVVDTSCGAFDYGKFGHALGCRVLLDDGMREDVNRLVLRGDKICMYKYSAEIVGEGSVSGETWCIGDKGMRIIYSKMECVSEGI